MSKKLVMNLPKEFVDALGRRHSGGTLFYTNPKFYTKKMNKLYREYNKLSAQLTHLLDVEWDEKNIEGHFGEPIFYGAHRRLGNLEKKVKDKHRGMFQLLLLLDGNSESFNQSTCISPIDIYEDFKGKYIEK